VSAYPLTADMLSVDIDVCKVPLADIPSILLPRLTHV
jgi:hypothetical protein